MRALLFTFALLLSFIFSKAQKGDYEVKVVSAHMQNVKGMLQKVSKDGLAVLDYRGNYLIFKAKDIIKVKIRKRGLTVGKGAATGALAGVVVGAAILSLDEENTSKQTYQVAALVGIISTVTGTLTGLVAEFVNVKHNLYINGDPRKFERNYKMLEKYIKEIKIEHF